MRKLLYISLISICVNFLCGCALFDLDGNGRFDPIAYLEGADITVGWVGDDGMAYNVALDDLGMQLLGQFVQSKTGYLFEVADDGALTITNPDGVEIRLARKG